MNEIKVFGSHCPQLVCTFSDMCRQDGRFFVGKKQNKQLKTNTRGTASRWHGQSGEQACL